MEGFLHRQLKKAIKGSSRMRIPCHKLLRKERLDYRVSSTGEAMRSYASGIHPNPRFFKYYWWIFWNESRADGRAFFSDRHRLATADAMDLLQGLIELREPCWIYNQRLPRAGVDTPFDLTRARWFDAEIAPGYDDDQDAIAEGMLAGHR